MTNALAKPGTDGLIGGPGGTAISPNVLTYSANVPVIARVAVTPATGADWSLTMPVLGQSLGSFAGPVWCRLNSGFTVLNTDATVISRMAGMFVTDPQGKYVSRYFQTGATNVLFTAGIAGHLTYTRTDKYTQAGNSVPGVTESAVGSPSLLIPPGYTLGSITGNLQPADHYSTVNLWLEIWSGGASPVLSVPGPQL